MNQDRRKPGQGSEPAKGRIMPFHATFLAIVAPPMAAALCLRALGADPLGLRLLASGLAPAYLLGAAPAFLGGRLDRTLAEGGATALARLLVAALFGGGLGLVILLPLYLAGLVSGTIPMLVPATFCLAAVTALGLAMSLAWMLARMNGNKRTRETTNDA